MSVVYAAYAAPGMMKMGLGCGSLGLEVSVGWEAVRSLEPRARVSVWPGRRRIPGIVAPDSWGARGAECLPCDVPRRSSPATSSRDGTTARRCLCHRTGSGTTEARPPRKQCTPGASWGSGGFIAPPGQFRAGFSEQFIILARKDELTTDFPL